MGLSEGAFDGLVSFATKKLAGQELLLAVLQGERSDFCRLNDAKVRQAGTVMQAGLSLRLVDGKRHAGGEVTLSGQRAEDEGRVASLLTTLRDQVKELPEDPHLMFATEVSSSRSVEPSTLSDARDQVMRVSDAAKGSDLVGIYAAGDVYRGFGNSLGQRNWFQRSSFNLDFSLYLRADKAVKTGYAGFAWDDAEFGRKLERAREQLGVLEREPRTIKPGRYRVYLAPQALSEVTGMLAWGGFSMKAHKTKQTALIKMVESAAKMHDAVTISENTAGGMAPNFNGTGFLKPPQVVMIGGGSYRDCLVSPRSAKEYGVTTNAADPGEGPESLDVAPGDLALDDVLKELGDGIYVNNLWYLNFSDRPACRVTGMTRFASFWVEKGKIAAPLNVMRFDESVLRMLGDKLVGLTKEREMLPSASTYGNRQTASARLPGALIDDFSFTL